MVAMGSGSSKSVPICFFDGLLCEHYGQCEIWTFGVLGDEVVWRCRRLEKSDGKLSKDEVLDRIERKYVKKKWS